MNEPPKIIFEHVWCAHGHKDKNNNLKYILVQVDTPGKRRQHLETKAHCSWLKERLKELQQKREAEERFSNRPRLFACPSPPTFNSYVWFQLLV